MASTTANFKPLRSALLSEQWDEVEKHLTVAKSLKEYLTDGFVLRGDQLFFNDQELPPEIVVRVHGMAAQGEDPTTLLNFYKLLTGNPSFRSVQQLFTFLKHSNIPLTPDGHFLAYKSVKRDYKDHHSGLFDNHPGTVNEMPRNQISDDPRVACDEGFHVGALSYVQQYYGGADSRVVICKVNPADVVCVPYDESERKIRVCRYEVVGHQGAELPSTSITDLTPVESRTLSVGSRPEDEDEDPDYKAAKAAMDAYEDVDEVDDDHEDDDSMAEAAAHGALSKEKKAEFVTKEHRPRKDKPEQVSRTSRPKKRTAAHKKLDKMSGLKLMEQSIDVLREYAFKGLEIVGASKIPGGKTALVARILDVRSK